MAYKADAECWSRGRGRRAEESINFMLASSTLEHSISHSSHKYVSHTWEKIGEQKSGRENLWRNFSLWFRVESWATLRRELHRRKLIDSWSRSQRVNMKRHSKIFSQTIKWRRRSENRLKFSLWMTLQFQAQFIRLREKKRAGIRKTSNWKALEHWWNESWNDSRVEWAFTICLVWNKRWENGRNRSREKVFIILIEKFYEMLEKLFSDPDSKLSVEWSKYTRNDSRNWKMLFPSFSLSLSLPLSYPCCRRISANIYISKCILPNSNFTQKEDGKIV